MAFLERLLEQRSYFYEDEDGKRSCGPAPKGELRQMLRQDEVKVPFLTRVALRLPLIEHGLIRHAAAQGASIKSK